jgi:hypothetical protein
MENSIKYFVTKLIELIKQTFKFRDTPHIVCQQSRVSCEAILKQIYKREIGDLPKLIMFDQLLKSIVKNNPQTIPTRIQALFGTVQIYGNIAAHAQDDMEQLDSTHADMVEKALGSIFNWFTNEYLQIDIDHGELFTRENNRQSQFVTNYKDLLYAALEDKKLTVEEYESILKARNDIEITNEEIQKIESDVFFEKLGSDQLQLIDLIESFDLADFKKFEKNLDHSDFVTNSLKAADELQNPQWQGYLERYVGKGNQSDILEPSILGLTGAWQGWYFQSDSKTYFSLFFIAKNEEEFIGISIEPKNPNWQNHHINDHIISASIEGSLSDNIIIEFRKTYLFENSWDIDYMGVILDEGNSFEGEWTIRQLNGAFNAMKTKSMLPVRIFNTLEKLPVANTIYLDQLKLITGTYLVQLIGKSSGFFIMHLLELNGCIHINIIAPFETQIHKRYSMTTHYQSSKIDFNVLNWENLDDIDCNISISIDHTNGKINGVLKDDKNKMRIIKGLKL